MIKNKIKAILIATGLASLIGCSGSIEPSVIFGANCIGNEGVSYKSATGFGIRGRIKTPSKVEAELEFDCFNTIGGVNGLNHDVKATELSVNVLYPFCSCEQVEVYAGLGTTNTSQTITETADGFSGSGTFSQSETDIRIIAGARISAGKGSIDGRISTGSRGTTVSAGYIFEF